MAYKRWYNNIEVEGSADIDLNQLIKEHREDAIRLFTDEELQKELQLRKDGKSKMEKYISMLDTQAILKCMRRKGKKLCQSV